MTLKKPLIIFVLLMIVAVSPALAVAYTLTGYQESDVFDVQKIYFYDQTSISFDQSAEDKAITLIHFKVPQGHTVSYTLYYGTGTTTSGSASNAYNFSLLPAQITTSTIVFNGETKSYSYFDTNPEFDYYMSGYARDDINQTPGIIVYSAGYGGFDNDLAIFKPVSNLPTNLIYRVDMSCDVPFDADVSFGSKGAVAETVSKTAIDVVSDWGGVFKKIAGDVMDFAILFYNGLIFLWDAKFLIISLYIGICGAIAFNQSKDVFSALKKFFTYQKTLFLFFIQLWHALVTTIESAKNILTKWI